MKRTALVVWAMFGAGTALAQDSALSVSVGVRGWYTDWTTFSYYAPDGITNLALTQISADNKFVLMPTLSARYGDFIASASAFTSTRFSFDDGSTGKRDEFDVNVGYAVTPGLALTLGYKRVSQSGDSGVYRPAGPVLGISANAPLGSGLSLYGSLGLGRLRTPGGDAIDFKADYRLAELGLGYALNTGRPRWTITGGYRIQVLTSKDALDSQDGRDTTQGFTLGVIATF